MAARPFLWNLFAKGYAKRPVPDAAIYQHKLDVTRRYMVPGAEVLEIGCGTGTTALYHAPAAGHIRAVDFSVNMIAIAREKAADAGIGNVDFQVGALEDLPDAPETYDMVMAHSILHLIDNRAAVIARCQSMLKPGGIFVSSTLCFGRVNPVVRVLVAAIRMTGIAPNIHLFSEDQLVGEVEAAGFEIVERSEPKPRTALFLVARKPG